MFTYIVCFCGMPLGDIADAYKALRMRKLMKYYKIIGYNIDPSMLAISDMGIHEGKLLDSLGLDQECCRTRIMTQVEFKELYN